MTSVSSFITLLLYGLPRTSSGAILHNNKHCNHKTDTVNRLIEVNGTIPAWGAGNRRTSDAIVRQTSGKAEIRDLNRTFIMNQHIIALNISVQSM